jgi:hypothetical protein
MQYIFRTGGIGALFIILCALLALAFSATQGTGHAAPLSQEATPAAEPTPRADLTPTAETAPAAETAAAATAAAATAVATPAAEADVPLSGVGIEEGGAPIGMIAGLGLVLLLGIGLALYAFTQSRQE